jgi:hypothetical protein
MNTELTQAELARINDTAHSIQSADENLAEVNPRKIPGYEEIRACLQNADKTLRKVMRALRPPIRQS